jgi:hypothetical protein
MFVGKEDYLAHHQDCDWARSQIKSMVYYEELEDFDHSTFISGKDMSYFVKVLDLIKKFNV